jgi:hypothetical protein
MVSHFCILTEQNVSMKLQASIGLCIQAPHNAAPTALGHTCHCKCNACKLHIIVHSLQSNVELQS